MFEFLALVAVDPAEELGVVWGAGAVSDAMGPVLGEAVFFSEPFEAGISDGELHHHVGLSGLLVVPPQRCQWLLYAAFTWKETKNI